MGKIIRHSYPAAFSIALLCLIYVVVFFLSHQIFAVPISDLNEDRTVFIGMFLVATAVIIMILIVWEEFLFPIRTKEVNGGMVFRNHRQKIQTQLLFYCIIPAIFIFIYLEYEINLLRFIIWSAICILVPLLEKIISGIKNYNDFLSLTDQDIAYKDNEKEGRYEVKNIASITIITYQKDATHQIELLFKNNDKVTIDLHKMELEAYYDFIYKYMSAHYKTLLLEKKVV